MSVLQVKNISKSFDDEKIIENISLELHEGEIVSLLGVSGGGKTTLFNIISGLLTPDEGKVYLDGEDITRMPEYKRSRYFGRLFQDPMAGTAPGLTIEENLSLVLLQGREGAGAFSRISRQDREMFREKLSALGMGLEDRLKQPVGLLSGGQRQALALLLATLYPPKLLMLDEHTAALDPASAARIMALTENIVRGSGITCLMITHNMQQAIETGDRTVIMSGGRIVSDISGDQRRGMSVSDLTEMFRLAAGAEYANDRMLFSEGF